MEDASLEETQPAEATTRASASSLKSPGATSKVTPRGRMQQRNSKFDKKRQALSNSSVADSPFLVQPSVRSTKPRSHKEWDDHCFFNTAQFSTGKRAEKDLGKVMTAGQIHAVLPTVAGASPRKEPKGMTTSPRSKTSPNPVPPRKSHRSPERSPRRPLQSGSEASSSTADSPAISIPEPGDTKPSPETTPGTTDSKPKPTKSPPRSPRSRKPRRSRVNQGAIRLNGDEVEKDRPPTRAVTLGGNRFIFEKAGVVVGNHGIESVPPWLELAVAQLKLERFQFAEPSRKDGAGSYVCVVDPITGHKFVLRFFTLLNHQRTDFFAEMLVHLDCYRSPYLVSMFNAYLIPDKLQLAAVFEHLQYGDLGRAIKKLGPMPELVVAVVLRNVLNAIDYLHNIKGVVHNAIEPANLYIGSNGSIKLGGLKHCHFLTKPGAGTHASDSYLPKFTGSPKVKMSIPDLQLDCRLWPQSGCLGCVT